MNRVKTLKKYSKGTKYKQRTISVWNEVARFYHRRWAKDEIGPFGVTKKLLEISKIKKGDSVLDLACGTGLVTKKLIRKVGKTCLLYTSPSPRDGLLSRMPSSA